MPYENLALQLKADNWARVRERLLAEYQTLDFVPETVRAELQAFLDTQRTIVERKLQSFEQHVIKPNPPGTRY